jgi:putative DNA primase/helicase
MTDNIDNIVRLAEIKASDQRPVVRLRTGDLDELAAEVEAVLIEEGAQLYVYGSNLVRPVKEEARGFRGKTMVARLQLASPDMLRGHLSRVIRFEKYDQRSSSYTPIDPPYSIVRTLLERADAWQLPRLNGIITTPTLRPDGTVLAEEGFDAETGLLLLSPPSMPAIPERPTLHDAATALQLLQDLLAEFPFTNEASKAVGLSALITPVVRGALQVAPLHVLTAPEAGSGKSYLIDIASAIATGEVAPVIAAGRNEEETEKRLVADLLSGQAIINIDNLNGDLGGDFLCQAIERPIIRPRILGKSENKRIPNAATFYANGNNLHLTGDVVRRAVRARLDAGIERPELREFRGNPVQAVLADRGRYIAACLTVVRAYMAAGYPDCRKPLASFEDWSRLVRSALVWLHCDDPVETVADAREEDPARNDLEAVIAAWRAVVGLNVKVTAGDLKKASGDREKDKDRALERALSAVAMARNGEEIEARRLGIWLASNKDRVIDGCTLMGEYDTHAKQRLWSLKDKSAGRAGCRG